jgi:hypothetical protein
MVLSMPNLDTQQSALVAGLDALNESRLAAGYGNLPRDIDAATLAAVQMVPHVGTSMRDAAGNVRPFSISPAIALAIVKALRGEKTQTSFDEGGWLVP